MVYGGFTADPQARLTSKDGIGMGITLSATLAMAVYMVWVQKTRVRTTQPWYCSICLKTILQDQALQAEVSLLFVAGHVKRGVYPVCQLLFHAGLCAAAVDPF